MSDKPKFPRDAALIVAQEWYDRVFELCEPDRLMICGSLRRNKSMVGDIELVYVPRKKTRPKAGEMFAQEIYDLVTDELDRAVRDGVLRKRLKVNGSLTGWGEDNKFAVHVNSGIPMDFFATSEENWWTTIVIRTGSKETNMRLTTGAIARGLTLNAYGSGFTHLRTQEKIICRSERDVFHHAGVPYLEPKDR